MQCRKVLLLHGNGRHIHQIRCRQSPKWKQSGCQQKRVETGHQWCIQESCIQYSDEHTFSHVSLVVKAAEPDHIDLII